MDPQNLIDQFADSITACRHLFVDKLAEDVVTSGEVGAPQRQAALAEIESGFNRLLMKVYVEVAWSDRVWSRGEALIAKKLLEDLLRHPLREKDLGQAMNHLAAIASAESWQSVLRPFTTLKATSDYRSQFHSELMRMANIIAKIDGNVTHETIGQLKNINWQLHQFLALPPAPSQPPQTTQHPRNGLHFENLASELSSASQEINPTYFNAPVRIGATLDQDQPPVDAGAVVMDKDSEDDVQKLDRALAEIDSLIGIDEVKAEIRGLVNFLKVQAHRKAAGLPANPISLHMVFEGNPGTGKTTVVRILGQVFGAMGILKKGHLIETDRSGLVAEYVGQTATKTNAIIDEALDGVLFIDEAYSLISEDNKDSYGAEGLQILLKRAEDDRDRLIVILAGYTLPMQRMLSSNPGLSSRFSRRFAFPDFNTSELCQIFDRLADGNRYTISGSVRSKLIEQIEFATENKDQHFGNGRFIRNYFETAMRRLADRVVDIQELSPELLTNFEESDIAIESLSSCSQQSSAVS